MKAAGLMSIGLAVQLAAASAMAANTNIISPEKRDVPENTSVSLNISGNADGCAFSWSQTGGPTAAIGVSGNANRKLDITTPEVGASGAVLTFQLKVSGPSCAVKGAYLATVNVNDVADPVAANKPPKAVITSPESVNEGALVTLDGSNSNDPDKDALSYQWEQISGPQVALSSYNGPVATFTAPDDAYPNGVTRVFKLTVSDGSLIDTTTKSVTVKWINDPPRAVVSCPESVDERASLTLFGSGSTDNDDGIATYAWRQSYGGPVAALPDPATAADLTLAAPTLDSTFKTMTFGLTVTDNGGLFDSASCSVLVNDITPPVLSGMPVSRTLEATSKNGAAAFFDMPTAKDAVDGERTVTCSAASGATFQLDQTTAVTCSASDLSNNTASASFGIKVVDTTPPTFTAPASFTTLATSATGAVVSYSTPTASDLVDGYFLASCSPASGSALGFNQNTVTCGASDTHGNAAANQNFSVTVIYGFKGLLSPYDASRAYKIKSALPIKWQYTSNTGAVLASAGARPTVAIYKVASNGVESATAITLDDSGASGYQYDSTTNTWQYNWKTTGLTAGAYDIYVTSATTGQTNGPFKAQLAN